MIHNTGTTIHPSAFSSDLFCETISNAVSSLTGLGGSDCITDPPLKRWAILCRPETGLKKHTSLASTAGQCGHSRFEPMTARSRKLISSSFTAFTHVASYLSTDNALIRHQKCRVRVVHASVRSPAAWPAMTRRSDWSGTPVPSEHTDRCCISASCLWL